MPEQIENHMVVDSHWNEVEYGVPMSSRLTKERQAYEDAEREDSDERKNY